MPPPKGGLHFSVPKSSPVAMTIGDTVRYQLEDGFAAEEYARLMPSGGHIVYVADGPDSSRGEGEKGGQGPRAYTVALFHQLKCLDIIRRDLTNSSLTAPTQLASHCMNYLRQMILCKANTRLESVKHPLGAVERTYDATCKDWELVYREAERNYHAFTGLMNGTTTEVL
ncbi:hypothetical protein DAEQUDRAFT_727763 [Daedalea quercina L-15889]|uniref:Uncharacterized protein n=1 Tax=Daedalea quercina L-15889 TaxID=1314783 RepID=A0A165PUK8_9APHY|nr:hypothetical protein DAEQUDRAFT_727763 [Daedalea quercina L-15889]